MKVPSVQDIEAGYVFEEAYRRVIAPRVKKDKWGKYSHRVVCIACGDIAIVRDGHLRKGTHCRCLNSKNSESIRPQEVEKGCEIGEKVVIQPRVRKKINTEGVVYYHLVHCRRCKKKYELSHASFIQGKRCNRCIKSLTNEEYRTRLHDMGSIVEPLQEIVDMGTKINHRCPVCKREDWKIHPGAVMTGTTMCIECSHNAMDSVLATGLKQVLGKMLGARSEVDLNYKDGSLFDIVLEDRKEIIEVQSRFHDQEDNPNGRNKKGERLYRYKDTQKKEYAEELGYHVTYIDIRDYTLLEACQLYIKGITIEVILEIVDFSIILKEKIVQLDLKGNVVKIYSGGILEITSLYNLKKGGHLGLATRGKNRKQGHMWRGYLWYKYTEFMAENFTIQEVTKKQIRDNKNAHGRRVVQLDSEYKVVGVFASPNKAAEQVGVTVSHIYGVCNRRYGRKSTKGFIWMYESDYDKLSEVDFLRLKDERFTFSGSKVVRLDCEGRFLMKYEDGIEQALKNLEKASYSKLRNALNGKNSTLGHMYHDSLWYYEEEYEQQNFTCQQVSEEQMKKKNVRAGRRVVQMNDNFEVVHEFLSMGIAARELGVAASKIYRVCIGERQHIKGFRFRFAEADVNI